ncbi:helix-turn-helix domain-containing protein [Kitasatospora sp. NPDC002040]|uniref:helix-turn-helix domain-containing protein n=1 Tax=Kitasatospora sp. NPDC002040 TaxID=3154661 RepID=UPI003327577C
MVGEGELLAELLAAVRDLAGRPAARSWLVRLASAATVSAEALRAAVEAAGLDPDEGFQGWVAAGPGVSGAQERLDGLAGRCAAEEGPEGLLILAQGVPEAEVAAALGPDGRVAVGLLRIGPDAARETLRDARAAAALAAGRAGLWRYQDLWPLTATATAADRLDPLLAPAVATARTFPHLADAVRAFADHGFAVGPAARVLRVPADTLIRRLDRWQQLTGADLRTLPGLTASRTAVELAARGR